MKIAHGVFMCIFNSLYLLVTACHDNIEEYIIKNDLLLACMIFIENTIRMVHNNLRIFRIKIFY